MKSLCMICAQKEHRGFFKYFRTTPETFDKLLGKVSPLIQKKNTRKDVVTPAERLAVTLR